MKNCLNRIWEEHKSSKKILQDVREGDHAKALEKMIRILSKSQDSVDIHFSCFSLSSSLADRELILNMTSILNHH